MQTQGLHRIVSIILACALCGMGVAAQTRQPVTLAALKATFDTTSARIAGDLQQKRNAASAQYGRTLDGLLPALRKKGELDSYLAIEQEINRFKTDKTVPEDVVDAPLAIVATAYHQQIAAAEAEAAKRNADLLRQYITALTGLIKDLVKQDKMQDAMAAKEVKLGAEADLAAEEARLALPAVPNPDAATAAGSDGHAVTSAPPAALSLAPSPSVTFTVHASEMGAGTWCTTSLQADEGRWIVAEVTPMETLKSAKPSKGRRPQITFRIQGGSESSDALWINPDNTDKKPLRTVLKASTTGRVQYTTEGAFSVRVTLTSRTTPPKRRSSDTDERVDL